jgi:hypothetical protein
VLSLVVRSARKRRLIKEPGQVGRSTPRAAQAVGHPQPAEVKRVNAAFGQLAAAADSEERVWIEQAQVKALVESQFSDAHHAAGRRNRRRRSRLPVVRQ